MDDSRKPPVLVVGIAILSVLIVLASAFLALRNGFFEDASADTSSVLRLKNPSASTINVSNSCAPINPENLQNFTSFAFSGTVSNVDSGNAVMTVDTIYRGNVAIARGEVPEQVSIPQGEDLGADGSSLVFQTGQRYLVAVDSDDTVISCGYSGIYSDEFAQEYKNAFSTDVEG